MADYRLNELLPLINQQVEYQEIIRDHLSKAEALTNVSLMDNFLDSPKSTLYNYLCILNDIVEETRKLNELSLNRLLKRTLPSFID